jgi:hypothetical protein
MIMAIRTSLVNPSSLGYMFSLQATIRLNPLDGAARIMPPCFTGHPVVAELRMMATMIRN